MWGFGSCVRVLVGRLYELKREHSSTSLECTTAAPYFLPSNAGGALHCTCNDHNIFQLQWRRTRWRQVGKLAGGAGARWRWRQVPRWRWRQVGGHVHPGVRPAGRWSPVPRGRVSMAGQVVTRPQGTGERGWTVVTRPQQDTPIGVSDRGILDLLLGASKEGNGSKSGAFSLLFQRLLKASKES